MFFKAFLVGIILHWSVLQLLIDAQTVTPISLQCNGSLLNSSSILQNYNDCVVNNLLVVGCFAIPFFSSVLSNCYWCYGKWGCFQIGGPFISPPRPINLPPQPPEIINITIQLYTRNNPDAPFVFYLDDISQIDNSFFNEDEDSKFLIGGFLNGDFAPYFTSIRDLLLTKGNFNVFVVDWLTGSEPPYIQATANTRMVGAVLASFIESLNAIKGYPFTSVHIIGHSLGGQTAGYAGQRIPGLGRISGLDPAGPYFDGTDHIVRLDPTDANFVDVIHTNAGLLILDDYGTTQNCGDLDFWPNGGTYQPACSPLQLPYNPPLLATILYCSHLMAIYYFTESISGSAGCTFQAYQCVDYATFEMVACNTCGNNGSSCAFMGYYADQYVLDGHYIPASPPFYLNTNPAVPYCLS